MSINIARFDLASIRLVVLCADMGSLSAAAKHAHCSVSSGSQRLSALEGVLGRKLLIRDYRGVQLTAAGEVFVRHGKVILEHLELMKTQVASVDCPLAESFKFHKHQGNPYSGS